MAIKKKAAKAARVKKLKLYHWYGLLVEAAAKELKRQRTYAMRGAKRLGEKWGPAS